MGKVKTVLDLSMQDLWAEKVMTACLILAIAAVVTPLLVLGSIKVGFVDRLTDELIKDPTYRELQPGDAELKSDEFFIALQNSEHIEFSVPTVMMVPREVVVRKSGSANRFEGRLVPTGDGDPLLAKSGVGELTKEDVVLSGDLAEMANVTIGDQIDVLVLRTLRDKRDRVSTKLTIVGTFPPEFVNNPTIVAHPHLDVDVESWRAGLPVPRLDWHGTETSMRQSYEQIHVATDQRLTQFDLDALETRLGASSVQEIQWIDYLASMGLTGVLDDLDLPGGEKFHYRLQRNNGGFVSSDIQAVPGIVGDTQMLISGVSPNVEILGNSQGGDLRFVDFRLLGNACHPLCVGSNRPFFDLGDFTIFGADVADALTIDLDFSSDFSLQAKPAGGFELPPDVFLVDWQLGGLVGRGKETLLGYDKEANRFFEKTAGFRGFRAVAKDLYSVVSAADLVRQFGYAVRSSDDAIRRLQKLDQGLNILVAVVAGVALVGGFLVLGINFFANVQRKKLSFATLRLLGMRKLLIFMHPFFQSIAIVVSGFALSVLFYFGVQVYVNSAIAAGLGFGGNLSTLRPIHLLAAFLIVLIGSIVSCLISAFYIVRVDVSVALKEGNP